MTRRFTVEDWRRAVYRDPHVSDACKVFLLLLADYMRDDLSVSVKPEILAKALGRSERRIADRFREAVGEPRRIGDRERACRQTHRLLDRKVRGQKHLQAVYQGLVPEGLSTTHGCPAEDAPTEPWKPVSA